jgi:hypothetical protein
MTVTSPTRDMYWANRSLVSRAPHAICWSRQAALRPQVRGSSDAKQQSPDLAALRDAEATAQAAGRGVHTADSAARAAATFMFDADSAAIASDYMAARGRGVPVPAVVDVVLTGSTLKVVTLPDRAVLTVALAGAQSPNVRRGADGRLEGEPHGLEVRCVAFCVHVPYFLLTGAVLAVAPAGVHSLCMRTGAHGRREGEPRGLEVRRQVRARATGGFPLGCANMRAHAQRAEGGFAAESCGAHRRARGRAEPKCAKGCRRAAGRRAARARGALHIVCVYAVPTVC